MTCNLKIITELRIKFNAHQANPLHRGDMVIIIIIFINLSSRPHLCGRASEFASEAKKKENSGLKLETGFSKRGKNERSLKWKRISLTTARITIRILPLHLFSVCCGKGVARYIDDDGKEENTL